MSRSQASFARAESRATVFSGGVGDGRIRFRVQSAGHRLGIGLAIAVLIWLQLEVLSVTAASFAPGLIVTFTGASNAAAVDRIVLPNVMLFVAANTAPTSFVSPGPFQAEWSGWITAELRGDYTFEAEINGQFNLEINGTTVLQGTGQDQRITSERASRLNKGTNSIVAKFLARHPGDAYVRLRWKPKGSWTQPIPPGLFSHEAGTESLKQTEARHLGRELFMELRCANCHLSAPTGKANAEPSMDGPSFDGIGSRRQQGWLEQWILDPKSLRANARMPRFFSMAAKDKAVAAAAYLASLRDGFGNETLSGDSKGADNAQRESGRRLFEGLHCAACHDTAQSGQLDPTRVPLHQVTRKFGWKSLVEYLQRPEAHDVWSRMPNFKLSDDESKALASYLQGIATDVPQSGPAASTASLVEEGKSVVQALGCLNCHPSPLPNRFSGKRLDTVPVSAWTNLCVSPQAHTVSGVPWFSLTPQQTEALRIYVSNGPLQPNRPSPIEFAQFAMRDLRCAECHGKFEGFPPLDWLGEKLNPEWSRPFIAGELTYRPRSWLEARMPGFPAYSQGLSAGMAALHGYPPTSPKTASTDAAAAEVGRKLVSADGGLSCIACHAVGKVRATQVFENAGINLAYATARLRKSYYQRWIRNPLVIDPVSRMPMFFDEEFRSVLADIYDGDGAKQIEAIWQYLALGADLPPPPGTEAQ